MPGITSRSVFEGFCAVIFEIYCDSIYKSHSFQQLLKRIQTTDWFSPTTKKEGDSETPKICRTGVAYPQ
jgi:hypothetical protein